MKRHRVETRSVSRVATPALITLESDAVWARLETLVWSWINARNYDTSFRDEAWEELEAYLRNEADDPSHEGQRTAGSDGRTAAAESYPADIRQAFFDLELEPGASAKNVRSAYRRLLLKYHPDRFHTDAERAQTAAEITQRISLAYKRLNDYYS